MSGINEDLKYELLKTLQAGLTEDGLEKIEKQLQGVVDDIEADIEYWMRDSLSPMLVGYVSDMVIRTIDAILKGNEDEIRRYLHCEGRGYHGRSTDTCAERDISRQHPVIHAKLHENSCVALRRMIVDAHRDLITSERILDLEDQVKSLVSQVNKAEAGRDAIWEGWRRKGEENE